MEIKSASVKHDIFDGVITGENVSSYQKMYEDIKGIYQNEDSSLTNTVMYEVYSHACGDANEVGNLSWGLTILKPITVCDECNMTRGHFHENKTCAEYYFGIEGEGLLMLMREDGECWCEKVEKGSLHHIDGTLAHRLINTGDSDLKVGACWSPKAGHDYEAIEKKPFPYRVFKRNGKIEVE